jgi:hypothetical protein
VNASAGDALSHPFWHPCYLLFSIPHSLGAPIVPERSHTTSNVRKGQGWFFLDFIAHSVTLSVKQEKRGQKGGAKMVWKNGGCVQPWSLNAWFMFGMLSGHLEDLSFFDFTPSRNLGLDRPWTEVIPGSQCPDSTNKWMGPYNPYKKITHKYSSNATKSESIHIIGWLEFSVRSFLQALQWGVWMLNVDDLEVNYMSYSEWLAHLTVFVACGLEWCIPAIEFNWWY